MIAWSRSIRLVTFDVGGTLIHPDPSVGTIYAEVLTRRGFICSSKDADRAFEASWEEAAARGFSLCEQSAKNSAGERSFWRTLLEVMIRRLGGANPPEGTADELFERFGRGAAWKLYEDVVPTLQSLSESGIPMAVVSNWDSRLPALLRELDLRRYFGPLVVSALEACEKPDPRIFHLAARRAGVSPGEILHVGDQEREDCQGARMAGCRALKVQRKAGEASGLRIVLERLREEGESARGGKE